MFDYKQMKAAERVRKEIKAKHEAIELEATKKIKSPPTVNKKHRQQIEEMLDKISSFADYTFDYEEAIGELETTRPERTESRSPVLWVAPGTYSLSHSEYANREASRLKGEIRRMLQEYKYFYLNFPDYATLGASDVSKKYSYRNVDPYVLKVEKTLDELKTHGEQVTHEFKQTGANMAYMLGVPERELNG